MNLKRLRSRKTEFLAVGKTCKAMYSDFLSLTKKKKKKREREEFSLVLAVLDSQLMGPCSTPSQERQTNSEKD